MARRSTRRERAGRKSRGGSQRTRRAARARAGDARGGTRRWSRRVTETSHALDLEPGVFTKSDPAEIARSLRRSAERSRSRKSDPFRSAMSMLVFYVNRAGRGSSARQRGVLERAKDELRVLYGRAPHAAGRRRSA
ncbi:MAG TPA: DUF3175 domain-containing protein [Myxococcota bacterium]|jgi:hypothetical protein